MHCNKSTYLTRIVKNIIYVSNKNYQCNICCCPSSLSAEKGSIANPCSLLSEAFSLIPTFSDSPVAVAILITPGIYFEDLPFLSIPPSVTFIGCLSGIAFIPQLSLHHNSLQLQNINSSLLNIQRESKIEIDSCKFGMIRFMNDSGSSSINISYSEINSIHIDLERKDHVNLNMNNIKAMNPPEKDWLHVKMKDFSKLNISLTNSNLQLDDKNQLFLLMKNNSYFQYTKNNVTRIENGNFYYLHDKSIFNKITINNIVDHYKTKTHICYLELNDQSECNCKKSNVKYTIHEIEPINISVVHNMLKHQSKREIDLDNVLYHNNTSNTLFERVQKHESFLSYRLNNCQIKSKGVYNKSTNYDNSKTIGKNNTNTIDRIKNLSDKNSLEKNHFSQTYLFNNSNYQEMSFNSSYHSEETGLYALQYIEQRQNSQIIDTQTSSFYFNNSDFNRLQIQFDQSKSSLNFYNCKDNQSSGNLFKAIGKGTQSTSTYSDCSLNNIQYMIKNKEGHRLRISNSEINKLSCSGSLKASISGSSFENLNEIPITFTDGVEANVSSSNIFSQNTSAMHIRSSPSINVLSSFINLQKNPESSNELISIEKRSKILLGSSKLINESLGPILILKDPESQAEFSNLSLYHRNEFLVLGQPGSILISDPVAINKEISNKIQNDVQVLLNQVNVQQ